MAGASGWTIYHNNNTPFMTTSQWEELQVINKAGWAGMAVGGSMVSLTLVLGRDKK